MAKPHAEIDIARNPETQVSLGNSWYVGEQFREQLGKPGTRGNIFQDNLKSRAAGSALGTVGPLRYLDAGCGDGINLQWAAFLFTENDLDINITALDYNSLRIDRVRQKQLANDTHVASLLEMPFRDETFDMILCNHVLEHITEYHQALDEIWRVLKPGGLECRMKGVFLLN